MEDEIEAYLPNRLRSWAHPQQWLPDTLEDALIEAASEIESLTAEVERLREAYANEVKASVAISEILVATRKMLRKALKGA